MAGNDEIPGGTPGAQYQAEARAFSYSPAAFVAMETAIGKLSEDQRYELWMIAVGFLLARTAGEQREVEASRRDRYGSVADAAQGLIDALAYAGIPARADLQELVQRNRALMASSRQAQPANASTPDRKYFLFRLCSFWERATGSSPAASFRDKIVGNMQTGEKYGPAVDFLLAAASEPFEKKGQKSMTRDMADASIRTFRNAREVEEIERNHGSRILDDLTDTSLWKNE